MQLHDFLTLIHTTPDFPDQAVIAFESDSYPAHFFSQLLALLKSKLRSSQTTCMALDSEVHKLADIKAQLETSFLGNRMIYWVKNTHTLDAASKKLWLAYTKSYAGPHCILFYRESTKKEAEYGLTVELAEFIDAEFYKTLYMSLHTSTQFDASFIVKLLQHNQKITFDEACMLMSYQSIVGRNSDTFFARWLSKLIVPEKSLFTLSQYLFAQQSKLFFQHWKSLKNDFPDEFWVAYWSEQIWQATLFVARVQTSGYDVAKKSAFKLPFSFMNKDWKKYSPESLTQAHQFLYRLDHNLKNSAGTHGLELWYSTFLQSSF